MKQNFDIKNLSTPAKQAGTELCQLRLSLDMLLRLSLIFNKWHAWQKYNQAAKSSIKDDQDDFYKYKNGTDEDDDEDDKILWVIN